MRLLHVECLIQLLTLGAVLFPFSIACTPQQYQCDNGNCIPLTKLCDHFDDCADGSDEIRHVTGFKCQMGSRGNTCELPQRFLSDNSTQCADGADSCPSTRGVPSCTKCLNSNVTVTSRQICDGVIDCPDLSDECPCDATDARLLCNHMTFGQVIQCDNNSKTLPHSKVCDGVVDCTDMLDEMFCRHTLAKQTKVCAGYANITLLAFVCDGILECADLSDECSSNCANTPSFCSVSPNYASHGNQSFTCATNATVNITFNQWEICDGIWSACNPRIQQEEIGCLSRFYCQSGQPISIDSWKVCDGTKDCANGSDELNCTARFYCLSGSPVSVPISYMFDGFDDCSDGSDECPPALDTNLYSSRNEMIKNAGIKAWMWIMALAGLIGNTTVFVYTWKSLRGSNQSTLSKGNLYLVLNLNVADAMMSVYLLIVGIKSVEFSGSFCRQELSWRTSITCSSIGSFSTISAQVSLFTLVIMTSQRLYSVFYPIKAMSIRLRWILLPVIFTWCAFIVISAVPAMDPSLFVDGLWIPSKYLIAPIVRSATLEPLVRTLQLILERLPFPPILTLPDQEAYLSQTPFASKGRYGFYSENSLCVPHFFTPVTDNGWQYPTLLVTINLCAFTYVAIAYALIYWKSTSSGLQGAKNAEHSRNMQKRVTKLVLANFACWLPICIASFVQLGLPNEFSHLLFIVTAVFLFPINSVVNPILYSDVFEKLFRKACGYASKVVSPGPQIELSSAPNANSS